jgi:hypothetical protein
MTRQRHHGTSNRLNPKTAEILAKSRLHRSTNPGPGASVRPAPPGDVPCLDRVRAAFRPTMCALGLKRRNNAPPCVTYAP